MPGSGGPQRFVTVNKEGSVEFCEVKESPQLAFAVSRILRSGLMEGNLTFAFSSIIKQTSGQFAYSWENKFSVEGDNLAPAPTSASLTIRGRQSTMRSGVNASPDVSGDRVIGRIYNVASGNPSPERHSHHRHHQDHSRRKVRTRRQAERDDYEAYKTSDDDEDTPPAPASKIPSLEKDISITMRKRAVEGYGLDPIRNRRMVKDTSLQELWNWIDHAATISAGGRAFVNDYDFGFKGVLSILRGFPPHESASSPVPSSSQEAGNPGGKRGSGLTSRRNRAISQQTGPAGIVDDVRSSIKKGDANRAQEAAYVRACAAMNKKNGVTPFTISSRPAQRQLALASIGPDFANGDVASVIRRYEQHNQPEKAAAWALFSGNIELAIRSLKGNKGELNKLQKASS